VKIMASARNALILPLLVKNLLLPCSAEATEPLFKIWSLIEPPTNYVDEKGMPAGISVDVLRELQKLLNDTTPVEFLPSARALKFSKTEANILIFSLARNEDREQAGYQWIIQTTYKPWAFLGMKDSPLQIDSMEAARRLKIGTVHGSAYEHYLIENRFPNINASVSFASNILMLLAGRVDVVLSNRVTIISECKFVGNCKNSDFKSFFEPVGYSSWIAFSPNSDPRLVKKWKSAAEELMKNGTYEAIANKWSQRIANDLGAKTYINKDGVLVFDNQD